MMGGVALCAYMRSGWEASAWFGLARPCWAASPFRYFFNSEKKYNTEYNRKGGQGERKG
jgi:hypothetical protein